MAVSYIGAGSSNGGTASATQTPLVALPGTAAVGDVVIAVTAVERDTAQPAILWPSTGSAVLRSEVSATGAAGCQMEWKRLTSTDLGGSVRGTVPTARRIAFGFICLRGAADPVATNGTVVSSGTGDFAAEHPNVTPAVADSWLVSVMAATNGLGAVRTMAWTSTSGWTERVDDASTSASLNAGVYMAHKALTGQAGVSQTGNVATETDRFVYFPTTVVVAPSSGVLIPAGYDEVRLFTRT